MKLFINGEISEETSQYFFDKVLSSKGKKLDIYINSSGGCSYAAVSIMHFIKQAGKEVTTIALGECCSAAFFIYLLGDKRYATKYTLFMNHKDEVSSPSSTVHSLKGLTEATLKVCGLMEDDMASWMGITKKQHQKMLQKDAWFTAQQAKRLGIVDKIV